MSDKNTIGIVGGMGPHAGCVLYSNILKNTNATNDQDHLSVVMISYPKFIVDRTDFLEGNTSENPAYSVVRIIEKLRDTGARIIGMACNTIYAPEIYNTILQELSLRGCDVELVHMPYEVCLYIKRELPFVKKVGLMTTNGTYKSKVYTKILENLGYEIVIPDSNFQNDIINRMIYDPYYGIKASPDTIKNEVYILMNEALKFFRKRGVETLILGCTEFSILFKSFGINDIVVVDSMEVFAKSLISKANKAVSSTMQKVVI